MRVGGGGEGAAGNDDREQMPFTQVYVTGFSRQSRRDDLLAHFNREGSVTRDIVMKSRFAFIDFKRHEDAAVAVRDLDRSIFEDRQLTVQ